MIIVLVDGCGASIAKLTQYKLVDTTWKQIFEKDAVWKVAIQKWSKPYEPLSGLWCLLWKKMHATKTTPLSKYYMFQQMYIRRNDTITTPNQRQLMTYDIIGCVKRVLHESSHANAQTIKSWMYVYTLCYLLRQSMQQMYIDDGMVGTHISKQIQDILLVAPTRQITILLKMLQPAAT